MAERKREKKWGRKRGSEGRRNCIQNTKNTPYSLLLMLNRLTMFILWLIQCVFLLLLRGTYALTTYFLSLPLPTHRTKWKRVFFCVPKSQPQSTQIIVRFEFTFLLDKTITEFMIGRSKYVDGKRWRKRRERVRGSGRRVKIREGEKNQRNKKAKYKATMEYGKFSVGRRISYRLRWQKSLSYVFLHKQLTCFIENGKPCHCHHGTTTINHM